MAYIIAQDMIDAFGEEEVVALTNLDNPSATTINNVVLQQAIDDACATIDAYLQSRYTTPIVPTPAALVRIACDITRGELDQNNPRDEVIRRWEMAIAFLKDIAKGVASIPLPEPAATSDGLPGYVSNPPVFTMQSLEGF
jgi:phage gp36-like protein